MTATFYCQTCGRGGLVPETSIALKNGYRHPECPGLGEGDYWPFTRYEMPNGSEVFYRDDTHSYYSELKPVTQGRGEKKRVVAYQGVQAASLPSPSTVAKYADPNPDKLMGWSARMEREGFCLLIGEILDDSELLDLPVTPEVMRGLTDPEKVYEELQNRKLTWKDLRDAKGDTGQTAHDELELILRGEPGQSEVPESDAGYVEGVRAFFHDLGEWECIAQECVVYSAEHAFAGRFDALLRVPLTDHAGKSHEEVWLLDLKVSGFIGRSYHNQLAGYDLAARECGVGEPDRHIVLQVNEEGGYVPHEGHGTHEGFLWNLHSYRDGQRLDSAIRKDARERAREAEAVAA